MALNYQAIVEWLVPTIMAYGVWHLRCIHSELGKLNTHLAVLGERVDGHERRIDHLERA